MKMSCWLSWSGVVIWTFFNRGELRSGCKTGMQQGCHPRMALRSVGCVHLPWILWTQHRALLLWQQYKIPTSTARRSMWLSHHVRKSSPQHAFLDSSLSTQVTCHHSNISQFRCVYVSANIIIIPTFLKSSMSDLSKKSSPQFFSIQVCKPNHHHLNISRSTVSPKVEITSPTFLNASMSI